jgi:hypothetical protein
MQSYITVVQFCLNFNQAVYYSSCIVPYQGSDGGFLLYMLSAFCFIREANTVTVTKYTIKPAFLQNHK